MTFEPPEKAKGSACKGMSIMINHGTIFAISLLPKALGGHTYLYSGIVAYVPMPFLLLRLLVLMFEGS